MNRFDEDIEKLVKRGLSVFNENNNKNVIFDEELINNPELIEEIVGDLVNVWAWRRLFNRKIVDSEALRHIIYPSNDQEIKVKKPLPEEILITAILNAPSPNSRVIKKTIKWTPIQGDVLDSIFDYTEGIKQRIYALSYKQTNLFNFGINIDSIPVIKEVNNPLIRDITDYIKKENSEYNGGIEKSINDRTCYLWLFDREQPKSYYKLKSKDILSDEIKRERSYKSEIESWPYDKTVQNQINKQSGILKSTSQLDIRKLFQNKQSLYINFKPENLINFPYDDIISKIGEEEEYSFILENMKEGFRVRTNKTWFTINSENNIVKEADEETKHLKDNKERLIDFISKLCEKWFTCTKVWNIEKEYDIKLVDKIAELILWHPNDLYIKSARSWWGYSIIRIKKTENWNYIESDSFNFRKFIYEKKKSINDKRNALEKIIRTMYDTDCDKKEAFSTYYDNKKNMKAYYNNNFEIKAFLIELLKEINNPIIEEAIPYETIKWNIVEFRLICQRINDEFEINWYSKLSTNSVSANISLWGKWGELSSTLKNIYKKNLPEDITDPEIESKAKDMENTVYLKAKQLADKIYSFYDDEEKLGTPRDFAIDIVPSWNKDNSEIELYFLETNYQYWYTWLRDVNPELAKLVKDNTKRIINDDLSIN